MIDPIDPDDPGNTKLAIVDTRGGHLTLHHTKDLAGMVMSEPGRAPSSVRLTREDRAALIRELIALQEDEGIT